MALYGKVHRCICCRSCTAVMPAVVTATDPVCLLSVPGSTGLALQAGQGRQGARKRQASVHEVHARMPWCGCPACVCRAAQPSSLLGRHSVVGEAVVAEPTLAPDELQARPRLALPYRVGHGFDLHRLEEGPYKLILGGLEIPHDRGCVAHSDGGVRFGAGRPATRPVCPELHVWGLFRLKQSRRFFHCALSCLCGCRRRRPAAHNHRCGKRCASLFAITSSNSALPWPC